MKVAQELTDPFKVKMNWHPAWPMVTRRLHTQFGLTPPFVFAVQIWHDDARAQSPASRS